MVCAGRHRALAERSLRLVQEEPTATATVVALFLKVVDATAACVEGREGDLRVVLRFLSSFFCSPETASHVVVKHAASRELAYQISSDEKPSYCGGE